MKLEEYFGEWMQVIDRNELNQVVQRINKVDKNLLCPSYQDIFKAFRLCPYKELKSIMIGYDPYPQKGVATGILFGNRKEMKEMSPSLKIIKEACINFEIPHNSIIFDQTLESWCEQGILMINSALTTELGKTGVHTMLWRPFMTKLIKNLSEWNTGLIYVLFGEQAKTFKPYINKDWNYILEEKHPAYYARVGTKMPSDIFETITYITKEQYDEPVKFYSQL